MRHVALAALLLVFACGLPAWAEDEPAPPPVVEDAPAPVAPAPEAPAPVAPEVIVEEPPLTPIPAPPTPMPPIEPIAPIAPVQPVPAEPRVTPAVVSPPLKTAVLDIRKTHNLPWRCSCMGVRLDIDFMLVGQKGSYVGARVDFYNENGQPIKSVLYPFANQRGQVSAWTHLVRQTQDVARVHTALMIPYRAFPCACEGDSYLVTARVLLLRRVDRAQTAELARGETTFTVSSGSDDLPADEPLVAGFEGEQPRGTGGDASDRPYEEYRPQTPYGEWPDHSEMEDEWNERTRESPQRAAEELRQPEGPIRSR